MRNYLPRSRGNNWLSILVSASWYAAWSFAAVSTGLVFAQTDGKLLYHLLPSGLFLLTLYWQIIPILMVSAGMSLDLRKLVPYPVPHSQLFAIEVLLRITTAGEMLLMICGALAGLLFNRTVPAWAPWTLLIYIAFNLFLSVGLRDLLARVLARKRVRELLIFVMVLLAALPQILLRSVDSRSLNRFFAYEPGRIWPWMGAGHLALGTNDIPSLINVVCWTAAAYLFAKMQFGKNLRFDTSEAAAPDRIQSTRVSLLDRGFRLLPAILPDPLAALVDKEIRMLARSPRFRLVFLMGFSFGLIIWLPMAFGNKNPNSVFSSHYLTAVTVYGLMLLGEVCIWNVFGFDRSAVQIYYSAPVKLSTVLIAKNIAALFFVMAEALIIAFVCFLLRLPFTAAMLLESIMVTLTMALFLLAIGNMMSMKNPRPVDPGQSWRKTSAGKVQAMLLFIYAVVSAPVGLAYAARYAFESDIAFYAVLAFDIGVGIVVYWVAMDSALDTARFRKEDIVSVLSRGEGPLL